MLASIKKIRTGFEARIDFPIKGSVEEVWSWLTVNEKLKQWFPELRIEELGKGGKLLFDMSDGTYEEMEILEMIDQSVLAFTWGEDRVRFELHKEQEGCLLTFIESISTVTSHTPKDVAGWHVCLMMISWLVERKSINSRKEEWEKLYQEYLEVIRKLQEN